ncbi:Uncharacterized conserved protein YafD, endonuclease/exonuclease/phosphatase (EEP) superfamily [Ekhidna lutea]|uniref:Uncharacterized conserved protein YafD, endonuclease/exonuclease/phosphatase (EEP) superfamily n=1 Tax=Ekhidna lutea TaxID=447679 RepID=A0A239M386_EKHLU|nr:endonuclease/exonuclease/phosphatase family protein [Ekhidna lutea]SNT36369.1 Uncharacterized conserved protein YafD, endonuclease/exonuclease/phosphatase (EEP) superfamily [Ekhidna lutea]
MKLILLILSIIFIIGSFATLSKRAEWWIRAFDFPYLQFAVLGLWCTIEWLLFHFPQGWIDGIICSLTMTFFAYRLIVIWPYTSLKRPPLPKSKDSNPISILSANVLMTNDDFDGFLKLQKRAEPDILLLVEVNEIWKEHIHPTLSKEYKYQVLHPLDNTYGMMLYSKLPLQDSEVKFLVEKDVPSIHTKLKHPSGELMQFYGLHPRPPAPGENDESTPRDAELVIVGRMARETSLPVIVAGDMNDVAWSHTTRLFMRVSGLLDPRMGRGFYNTFHAERPLLRWPLDHIFLSHHFRIKKLKRLDNFNSDHFPILAEVTLNPSAHALASKEHADREDKEEAKEILASL